VAVFRRIRKRLMYAHCEAAVTAPQIARAMRQAGGEWVTLTGAR